MNNLMENEYIDKLAEDIRKEIDAELMFELFKTRGWYPVEDCQDLSFNYTALKEVEHWLTTSPAGRYHIKNHTTYIFERQDDAMMFALKWQ
jgi:hypothetical protein